MQQAGWEPGNVLPRQKKHEHVRKRQDAKEETEREERKTVSRSQRQASEVTVGMPSVIPINIRPGAGHGALVERYTEGDPEFVGGQRPSLSWDCIHRVQLITCTTPEIRRVQFHVTDQIGKACDASFMSP